MRCVHTLVPHLCLLGSGPPCVLSLGRALPLLDLDVSQRVAAGQRQVKRGWVGGIFLSYVPTAHGYCCILCVFYVFCPCLLICLSDCEQKNLKGF